MTPEESSMLQDLIQKVEETRLTEKDPEAEQMLQQGLARDPDAIYKLAQTVLIQNLALNQARAQIEQMKQTQQQAQPARATSFLGGLLGHRDPAPPAPQPQPQYQQVPYQQAPPQYATAPIYVESAPSPAGSFLRSAATTAAGVAAGALAFEGIESLMHGGFGGGWGGGGFGGGFGYCAPPVEETVINNYYDDPQRAGGFGGSRERGGEHEGSDDRREDRDSRGDGDGGDGASTGDGDSGDGDSSDFV